MAHQCIHCSAICEDDSQELLKGCSKCGSKFFFYMTADKLLKIQQARGGQNGGEGMPLGELTAEDKKTMEEDVREIVGLGDIDAPVVLDLETVKVTSPGKYILDIPNLFSKSRPLVYKLEDGKYVIDLSSSVRASGKQPIVK